MNRITIQSLSSALQRPGPVESAKRGLARFLLVGTVLIVLFAGTFPFDFSIPPAGISYAIQQQFDLVWLQYAGNVDRTENILFFLPFGFAMAANIRAKRFRIARQLIGTLVAGGILSTIVELSQVLVSFRDPSLQDIWCNTLGGVIGAAVFAFTGEHLLKLGAQGLVHLRALARPQILGGALIVYAALQLAAPLVIRKPGDLSVWDTGLPLNVGNAFPGSFPFEGTVSQVILADRAATAEEASQLFKGAEPSALFGKSLLADYRPRGRGPEYPDRTGTLAPLKWAKDPADEATAKDAPPEFGTDHWLSTGAAVAPATYRIGKTSELSIGVTVNPNRPDQHGPARIASIDRLPFAFDLSLSQEYSDLAIRLRTALRSAPDLQLHGVFEEPGTRHILVTHKEAQIVVYVDGIEQGRVEITPEAKVIWRIYPRPWFRMRIEQYGYRSYAAIYRLLVFIPFAALLGAMLATSAWPTRARWLVAAGATIAMALALEAILGTEAATGFEPKNLLISLCAGFVALGGMILQLHRRRQAL